ncbi:hypothetical protein Taro_002620 [Colocasia esculenta]|uniref:Uncharacterized protein n=1 Tax=Colocasia esculenta TaxID=4460 RepID=A0A843TH04_COLES|nr:hypothetical protein [Colocasia esculenta]
MISSLEDVSRITGLRIYGRPVSGYTYPCYHELAERLLELPVERRSSLVPRESLGLFDVRKNAGESEDEYLERPARVSRRELASEPGPQADLDLRRFLVLFLGRLLFATRGDAVHCRFLPLLEDLGEVWAYLHLPALGRGDLTRPGLVPIARRWDSRRDTRHLADQLERLQEAIDSYPYLDVIWKPYLGEGDEGQPWLVQARPYFVSARLAFGRVLWSSPFATGFAGPGRSFRGLHDPTDWRERAKEQIENWERRGKGVKSDATTDDAYLQAYALKYGGGYNWGDCIALSLTSLGGARSGGSAEADNGAAEGAGESEGHRSRWCSSSRGAGDSPSLLEAQLAGAVLRAEEAQRHLEERERDLQLTMEHAMDLQGQRDQLQGHRDQFQGEIQTTRSERGQLRIRAEAAKAQVAEATKELAALRVRLQTRQRW